MAIAGLLIPGEKFRYRQVPAIEMQGVCVCGVGFVNKVNRTHRPLDCV